jgi:limonene-1,2-epoxide hydrolase
VEVGRSNVGVVGGSSSAETVVQEFMATSIQAWSSGDASALARFFSEDAEYRNGPLPPASGRDAIIALLAEMMSMGGEVNVDLRHIVVDGPVVMTERVDHVTLGEKTASLRIAGVFEVHDGVITAWRDYFDATEFGLQSSAD